MRNDFSQQDVDSTIADLQQQIDRATVIINRLQNFNSVGVGSTMPTNLNSGIAVPPVSVLSASVRSYTPGVAHILVKWVLPNDSTGVDRYNVFVKGAESGQLQEMQVASVKTSPAVFPVHTDAARTVQIFVQTVLTNGQVLQISMCPSTTVNITDPGTITAAGDIDIKPGADSTTGVQIDNAAGSAVVTVDTVNIRLGVGIQPSYTIQANGTIAINSTYAETPTRIFQINGNGYVQLQAHISSTQEAPVQLTMADATGDFIINTTPTAVTPPSAPTYVEQFRITKDGKFGLGGIPSASKVAIIGLPTSSAGLAAGDIWVDTTAGLNYLKIV